MKKLYAKDVFGSLHEISIQEIKWRPSVYGIILEEGKILLSPQFDSGYDLPGGGVNLGENFEEAVIREVKEETGIDVVVKQNVGCLDSLFVWEPGNSHERKVYHSVLVYYLCEKVGGKISTSGFDEEEKKYASAALWMDLDGINRIKQASSVNYLPFIKRATEVKE